MKPILRFLGLVLVLGALAPAPAQAQLGAIIDMIQKMSGPAMLYYGPYLWVDVRDLTVRGAVVVGEDTRDDLATTEDVEGLMLQLTAEYRPLPRVGVEAGVSWHRFSGEFDTLEHYTFPARLNIQPFAHCRGWLWRSLRGGIGVHVVPPFPSGAFDGLYENMRDEWEFPLNYFAGLELSLDAVRSPALGC